MPGAAPAEAAVAIEPQPNGEARVHIFPVAEPTVRSPDALLVGGEYVAVTR